MKIHIVFPWQEGPYGGANQFLKALRQEMIQREIYAHDPDTADIIIVNGNPSSMSELLPGLVAFKQRKPHVPIITRLDGPISLIRGRGKRIDRMLAAWIHLMSDGVLYQSRWSQDQNERLYNTKAPFTAVIHNAPDPSIFYPAASSAEIHSPIRIIATSWSHHANKGFDVYDYLDKNLDFNRFGMTFVGNTPHPFKNIRHVAPQPSREVAQLLRDSDIYITASQHDPCSNSLLEALACGLPVVALSSGGHPELVQNGGVLFSSTENVIKSIELVAGNTESYRKNSPVISLSAATEKYLVFCKGILDAVNQKGYIPKKIPFFKKGALLLISELARRWP